VVALLGTERQLSGLRLCCRLYPEGRPKRQEVRALAVDAEVEWLILEALTPDRIALAVAELGEIEAESRPMERQWTLKWERA
jgi:hypothetical protein